MWFERLRSHSFGPFHEEELTFTEGLNVFYGPNEAGKSSWHAALLAGLCGRRRGPGKRLVEKRFEERHRPWGGGEWRVDLELQLTDGRRVGLTQNLETHTGLAKDIDLGRDYTDQILFEGAPDGSTWLGLNREVFPAVACVGQGLLLEILDEPESLQEHLQRAADTFGAEATAAEALSLIQDFRRTRVGTTRSNSRRPLRLAMEAVKEAERRFEQAGRQRIEFNELLMNYILNKRQLTETRAQVRLNQAALAGAEAQKSRARLEKAFRLAESHGFESESALVEKLQDRSQSVKVRIGELQQGQTLYSRLGAAGVVLLLVGIIGSTLREALWWGVSAFLPGVVALLVAWFRNRRLLAEESELGSEVMGLERLGTLLEGRSLEELAEGVRKLEEQAQEMADCLDPGELETVDLQRAESQLELLRSREKEQADELIRLETRLSERQRSIPSVAECEEALDGAKVELERVRRLERDLELTSGFLKRAEEQVHRNIAPHLSEVIRRWLPAVTGGRYRDARVDPETLVVEVQAESGDWREATRLSHGTAEQIYLLLRVALVQVLTRPDEICPLILDDVTVQSDSARTRAILDTLLVLAQERQIILFSQEDEVLEWAEEKLAGPAGRVVRLRPIGPGATSSR